MTITKTLKDARGYERSGYDVYAEIAQGVRPALGDVAKPGDWLPVLLEDKYFNEWFVILAGTILSMESAISGVNRIVPAVGGTDRTIVYRDQDVGYTVDADNPTGTSKALVAASGNATAKLEANLPMGWAWHHMYSGSIEARLINFEIQPFVSIVCDYEVELALVDADSGNQDFTPGSIIKPGVNTSVTPVRFGLPHLWEDGTDSAELMCGRVLYKGTIGEGTLSRSRIDLVKPVRGLQLSGVESDGRPRHLDAYELGSTTDKAADFIRANISHM
jgi:hypothetical protein